MPSFKYCAGRASGREVSGIIRAATIQEAQRILEDQGLYPMSLEENFEQTASRIRTGKKPALKQLALATRRMATLLDASVPMHEALSALCEQEKHSSFSTILEKVSAAVSEGSSLSKALETAPDLFDESYRGMVAAGEASGSLPAVLDNLAGFLEEREEIQARLLSALLYPLLMSFVGTGVLLFLLGFVVPKITVLFEANKAALPLITIVLIKTSNFVQTGWWAILAVVFALLWGSRYVFSNEQLRKKIDKIALQIPVAGFFIQTLSLSRMTKILGLLLASGVPMIKSLDITGHAVSNRTYRTMLEEVKTVLVEGGSLASAFEKQPLIPPIIVHLTAVGEKGGSLEQMLSKAAVSLERELDRAITRTMSLLEPLMVLAMGLAVGFVVLAVLLPVFELNQMIK